MKKATAVIGLLLVAFLLVMGAASAAPAPAAAPFAAALAATTTPYAPPPAPVVTVNHPVLDGPGDVLFSGSGYQPGERILITVTYADGSTYSFYVTADQNGDFSVYVKLTKPGKATLDALGLTSGRRASETVNVLPGGLETTTSTPNSGTTVTTTTVAGSPTSNSTGGGGGGGSGGGSTSSLSYTGVSIAGPLTVGIGVIVAGLALMLVGARLTVRRRRKPAHH